MEEEDVEDEDEHDLRRRQRRIRLLLVVLVLAGIAWAFAILYSVTNNSPEALDDADHDAVAAACADALEQLRALPDLDNDSDAFDAIALARDENEVFHAMIEGLRDIDADGDAGVALSKWLDDWETVIERRTEYIDELEATGEGRFESPLDVVLRVAKYAEAQGLEDCTPDALQPDVLDRARDYPEDE